MPNRDVTIHFSRSGDRNGFDLNPTTTYEVRINGGPPARFTPPWCQADLETHIENLRNEGDVRPTIALLKELGITLGASLHAIPGMEAALRRRSPDETITVFWKLDYPELARIPWELATRHQTPHSHLLNDSVAFVRQVPGLTQDAPVQWPTGRNESLRLLFMWGETKQDDVPHKEHRAALEKICARCGVDFEAREVANISQLAEGCGKPVHFVHILAHGASSDGRWGLRLRDEVVSPEQIAMALRARGTLPAIVTVAACDSANDKDNSFGSVAYQLHMHGVPFVMASQFRLRKRVSNLSVAMAYEQLLSGGDLRDMLSGIRRQLAASDNEAWANEVIYCRYRYESLEELAVVARQQGVLRRANHIEKQARGASDEESEKFIQDLNKETLRLRDLLDTLKQRDAPPQAMAETYGLLGSLERRKAVLRASPPDEDDLYQALQYYEDGIRADANSHYCGINVVHLSLRLGEQAKAQQFIPIVRFATQNQLARDVWAIATAGELEVYAGNRAEATDHYRQFVRAVEASVNGDAAIVTTLTSSSRQLDKITQLFTDADVSDAAAACLRIVQRAIKRHSENEPR